MTKRIKPELEEVARINQAIIEKMISFLGLSCQLELAQRLKINPASLSNYKSGRATMQASLIIKIHELTGWPVRDIKADLQYPGAVKKSAEDKEEFVDVPVFATLDDSSEDFQSKADHGANDYE